MLREIWKIGVPDQARQRYFELLNNLAVLSDQGFLPRNPYTIVDAGYGSGAGLFALKKVFPNAKIIGIDNAETHQVWQRYKRRKIPKLSKFNVVNEDIFEIPYDIYRADLVLASRFPFRWVLEKKTKEEEDLIIAKRVLSVAKLVNENGTLLISYDLKYDGYPNVMRCLLRQIDFKKMFNSVNLVDGWGDDIWLILNKPNNINDPKSILRSI